MGARRRGGHQPMELRGGGSSSQLRLHGQGRVVVRGPDNRPNDNDDDASVRARLAKRNQIHTENHFPTLLGRNNVVGGSRHAVRHAANYKDASLKSLLSKLSTKSNGLSKLSTRAQTASKLSTKSSTVSKIMTRAGPGNDVPVYADAHAGGITIEFEVDRNEKKRRNKIKAMGLDRFPTTNSGSHKIDVVFDTVPKNNDAIAQMGMGTQGILSTWAKYGFEEDPETKKLREAQKQHLDEYGYNKFVDLLQQYIMEQIREFRLEHGESTRMPPLDITIKKTKEGSFEEGPLTYVTSEDKIYHAYEQFSTAIIAAAPSLSEEKLRYATNAIVKSTQSAIMSATDTVLTAHPISRTVIMPVDQLLSDPHQLAGIDDPRSFFIKYCVEYLCNQKNVSEEDYQTDSIFGGDVYNAIVNRTSDYRYMIGLQFRGKNVPAITDLKQGLRMNDKGDGKIRFYRGDDGKNDLIGIVVVGENAKLSSTDYGDYNEETPHLLLAAACRHHMSEEADGISPLGTNYDETNKANQGTFKELVARTITEAKMTFLDAAQEQEMDKVIQAAEAKGPDIKAYIDSLKHGGRLSFAAKVELVDNINKVNLIDKLALNHKIKMMKQKSIESNRDEVYDIINSTSNPLLQIYLANATDGAPYSKKDQYPQRYKEALETILENSYKGSLSALTGPLVKQISAFKVPENISDVDLSKFTWYQVYLIAVSKGAYGKIENNNFVNTASKEELIKMIQSKIAYLDKDSPPLGAAQEPVSSTSSERPRAQRFGSRAYSSLTGAISASNISPDVGPSDVFTKPEPDARFTIGQKLRWESPPEREHADVYVAKIPNTNDDTVFVIDKKGKTWYKRTIPIKEVKLSSSSGNPYKNPLSEDRLKGILDKAKEPEPTTTTTITPVTAPRQPSVSSEPSEVPNPPGEEGDITSTSPILVAEPTSKLRKPVKPKRLSLAEFTAIFGSYKATLSKEKKETFDESLKPAPGEEKVAKFMKVIQNNKDLNALYTKKMEAKLAEYEKTLAVYTKQEREKARLKQAEKEAMKAATAKAKAAKEAQAKADKQARDAANRDFAEKRNNTIVATLTDENGKYRNKLIQGDYYNKEFMIEQLEVVGIVLDDDDRKLLDRDGMGFIKQYILDDDVGELVKVAMARIVDFEKFFFEDEEQNVAPGQTKLYYQLMGKYRYLKYAQLLDWYGRPPVLTSDNVIKMYGNDEPESWLKLFTTCDTLFDDISIAGKDHYAQYKDMSEPESSKEATEQFQDLFKHSLLAGDAEKANSDREKALEGGADAEETLREYFTAVAFEVIRPDLVQRDVSNAAISDDELGDSTDYHPGPTQRRTFFLGRAIKNISTAVLVHLLEMPISTDEIKGLARAHLPTPLTEESIADKIGGLAVSDVEQGHGLSPLQWHVAFVTVDDLKATTTTDGREITLKPNDWENMEERDRKAIGNYITRGVTVPADLHNRITFYDLRNNAAEALATVINPYVKENPQTPIKEYDVNNLVQDDIEKIRALDSAEDFQRAVAIVEAYYRRNSDRGKMYGSITFEDDEPEPEQAVSVEPELQPQPQSVRKSSSKRKQSTPKRWAPAIQPPTHDIDTVANALGSLTADEVADRTQPATDIATLDTRRAPAALSVDSSASAEPYTSVPFYPLSPSYDANPFATLIRNLPLSPVEYSPHSTLPVAFFDNAILRQATLVQQSLEIGAWIRETSLKSAAAHFNLDPEVARQMYHYDTESDTNSDLRNNLRVRIQSLSPGLDDTQLTKELENAYVALFGPGNICKMD